MSRDEVVEVVTEVELNDANLEHVVAGLSKSGSGASQGSASKFASGGGGRVSKFAQGSSRR